MNPEREQSKSKTLGRAVNVAAALPTTAGGVGLAATVEGALKNTPSPIAQEAPEQDPLNRKPPEGVVWPVSQGGPASKSIPL